MRNPQPEAQSFRWIVSQIGARQHYGVPRGFACQGHLETLYTDIWCSFGGGLLQKGPATLRAFAGRYHEDLASHNIRSCTMMSLRSRFLARRNRSPASVYEEYLRFGESFSKWVTQRVAKLPLDPERTAFCGFNTGSLETLEMLRKRGVFTVVDQIDPARVEEQLVIQEAEKWPGWQDIPGWIPSAYFDRLAAEWESASLVIVNSEWSKQALIAQGVPDRKLTVTPVAYEVPKALVARLPPKAARRGPLTVLWLGTVNLRKGIQYLIGAARLLQRAPIRFVVVGPLEISQAARQTAPGNMSFLGRVTRDQTEAFFDEADIFVLPTVSDGFAITQIEAMAHGLPVVTTPNCGQVVTPGKDGFLVPAGDSHALADAIAKLDSDRDLLFAMSRNALSKALMFKLPRQAIEIEAAMRRLKQQQTLPSTPA